MNVCLHITAGGSNKIRLSDDRCQLWVEATDASGKKIECSTDTITVRSSTPDIADIDRNLRVQPIKTGDAIFDVTACIQGQDTKIRVCLPVVEGKTKPTWMTEKTRAIVRQNMQRYPWALEQVRTQYIEPADEYMKVADRLWDMVPAEGLPRCLTVGMDGDPMAYHCRYCGTDLLAEYGSYSWIIRPFEEPWKLTCPHCDRRFPSNDFESYYKLGLDEYGFFDAKVAKEKNDRLIQQGEQGYLINTLYPEKGKGWGVDDGFGYMPKDESGKPRVYPNGVLERHTYIGCYMHWGVWHKNQTGGGFAVEAATCLAHAYAYTHDVSYGRAGAILLDRIADVYPDYHYRAGNDYHGRGVDGKTIDYIWECGLAARLAQAYDLLYPVYDDREVINALNQKSETYTMRHAKHNAAQIRNNIEDGILRAGFEGAKNGELLGNFGYHQRAVAIMAVVLDTMPETGQWLDWIMADGDRKVPIRGGHVARTLIDIIDRDGMGNEASGYNVGWAKSMMDIANVLDGYETYPKADLFLHPKFKKMMTSLVPVIAGGYYSPQIGDSDATAGTGVWMTTEMAITGFVKYRDPMFAQIAYLTCGNDLTNIKPEITDANPYQIRQKIQAVIDREGPLDPKSEWMTGFGFAIVRDGARSMEPNKTDASQKGRDFWMYFGKNQGHGHFDTLNLGFSAYGLNMAPDLGYPERTGPQPNRLQWVKQTLSHNTVLVDGNTQNVPNSNGHGGYPIHLDDDENIKLMDVEAPKPFDQAEIYRRTLVMVRVDDECSYGVDFFRVLGGQSHVYSFHTQSDQIVETKGLTLTPQIDQNGCYIGSLAGADVPYGPDPNSPDKWFYKTVHPRGYTWTHTVERDQTKPKDFAVDYEIKDFRKVCTDASGLRLRLTMLADEPFDEVATAYGHTPKKSKNKMVPDLSYLFVTRRGDHLDTLFTSVIEPYRHHRTIKTIDSVRAIVMDGVESEQDVVRAVKVSLKENRTDYIVYATNSSITYRVDDRFVFRGQIGVYSVKNDRGHFSYLHDGDKLGDVTAPFAAVTGRIKDYTRTLSCKNVIVIAPDQKVEASSLSGCLIIVDNDKEQNGAYRICGAKRMPDGNIELDIGDVSLIRRYDNRSKPTYETNVLEGQTFRIPLSHCMDDI